jgi:Transposase IS66 family
LEPELKQMQSNLPDSDRTLRRTAKKRSGQGVQLLYTLTLWTRLSRFLEYAQLELSNNLAENAMRPIAPGTPQLDTYRQRASRTTRRGDRLRRRNLPTSQNPDPRVSLLDLARLGKLSINRVAELTPACWRARA